MGKIEADFKKTGAAVYLVSYEQADDLKKMQEAEKLGPTFVFLSDPQAKAADLYAGHYPLKPGQSSAVLKPATFVIGKNGKIVYAYVGEDFKVRADAQSVLETIKKSR